MRVPVSPSIARALVTVLFLSVPLLAQQADVRIEMATPPETGAGFAIPVYVAVENDGPDPSGPVFLNVYFPEQVTVSTLDAPCVQTFPTRISCDLSAFAPTERRLYVLNFVAPKERSGVVFDAEVSVADTGDPNPANNRVSAGTTVRTESDLDVSFRTQQERVLPGQLTTWLVELSNEGYADAEDVALDITLPAGAAIESISAPGWVCSRNGTDVTCSRPDLAVGAATSLEIVAHAPGDDRGGDFPASVAVRSALNDPDPSDNARMMVLHVDRILRVTTTSDDAPGSLREAIDAADQACDAGKLHCHVFFDLAGTPGSGWFTIQPLRALPVIGSAIEIDGTSQTVWHGDTNPSGPEIEINGALAGLSEGLVLEGCDSKIRGLAINGFQRNGILMQSSPCFLMREITGNYIGVDPTGSMARANTLRGVAMMSDRRGDTGNARIDGNVISGNGRSGIFLNGGSVFAMSANRIGVAANSPAPLSNGASGVYVGPFVNYADVSGNVVAYNGDFGVAVDYGSYDTSIRANSIHDNGGPGIDYGLDGVTPNDPGDGLPDAPVLTSAHYDPVSGRTIVEGFLEDVPEVPEQGSNIDLYASVSPDPSGYGEGERYVGSMGVANGSFSVAVDGDLRGRYITATSTHFQILGLGVKPPVASSGVSHAPVAPRNILDDIPESTSEFSNAVQVRP